MASKRPYPGNNPGKQLARHALYSLAKKHVAHGQLGQAITLAGPEAPEVPYLRDWLRREPKKTWFIDTDLNCIQDAKSRWPAVQTFHGTLANALQTLPLNRVNFANIDLMGQYTDRVVECVRLLSPMLSLGAIVGFTFKSGREVAETRHMRRILRLGEEAGGTSYNEQRRFGILRAIKEDFDRETRVLDTFQHNRIGSAMLNFVFQVF